MKRNVLVAVVVIILGLAAVWLAAGRSVPANAQGNGDGPATSAEASAGETAQSAGNHQEEGLLEGGELVSWRVVGSALKPRESDVSYTTSSSGGCTYVTAGDNFTVWNIPVLIPNGAVLDTLRIYYYDTSGSDSTAWLTSYDLYGAIAEEWSVSTSGNSGNSFNDSAQINHTVDYSVYSYLLNWRPGVSGSTMQLCGFRIFYIPPPFGWGFIPAVLDSP
jgi:hypothetical protein